MPLPYGWSNRDVGSYSPPGSTSYSSGTFIVNSSAGAGRAISTGNVSENFQFAFVPTSLDSGTLSIQCRCTALPTSEYGIMLRAALTNNAPYIALGGWGASSPGVNTVSMYAYRTVAGQPIYGTSTLAIPIDSYPWLRLVYDGVAKTVSLSVSADGSTWTPYVDSLTGLPVTNLSLPFTGLGYIGLWCSASFWLDGGGNARYSGPQVFGNVTVQSIAPPAVPVGPVTAVDTSVTGIQRARLSWAGRFLYFDYASAGQSNATNSLRFDPLSKGWVQDSYLAGAGASLHYLEEKYLENPSGSDPFYAQSAQRYIVVGGNDGALYMLDPAQAHDAGIPFTAQVATPLDNQGDTRARKQYGEVLLDYVGGPVSAVTQYDHAAVTANWTAALAAARVKLVHDLGLDATALHNDIGLALSWSSGSGTLLYEWQPSFFATPEDTYTRPTDWTDCGTPHYKYVHGLRIDADTGGVARTVQIQYDGGSAGPTLTVNHNGEMVKPYSFSPFKAHLVRLVPSGTASWRLFGIEWEVDPEPEPTGYWISQPTSFGMTGFAHIRDLQFAYATDTAGGSLAVIVDGVSYTLIASLPVTAGAESKLYVPAPPLKGKIWQLEAVGTNLQIYAQDCEFRVKPWGGQGYQSLKVLGDASGVGAKI